MDDATARAVAFVVGRLVTGRSSRGLTDRMDGARNGFAGSVTAERVSIYDEVGRSWVMGESRENGPLCLFSQATGQYVTLAPAGRGGYTGHDHATRQGFDVLAETGGAIEVIDSDGGTWRRFQLQEPELLAG